MMFEQLLRHGRWWLIFVFCVLCFEECLGAATRVNFSRCGVAGFTCTVLTNKNQEIVYECPKGTNDIIFYVNQFNSPSNTERLVIKNCIRATISTRCTGERKNLQSLTLSNITTLVFQRLAFQSHLPPYVTLQKIGYIDSVPSYTFSQIEKSIHTTGCILPAQDFKYLSLDNVNINIVQPNGFYMPNGLGVQVKFRSVAISQLQYAAMTFKLDHKKGEFVMEKSKVDIVEHLAMQIVGKNISFVDNDFGNVASSGINGTMGSFRFDGNRVSYSLEPSAVSVLATDVSVSNNSIHYLRGLALERISPGLLEDSGRSFGTLKFTYKFNGNRIVYTDPGCFHPHTVAYGNVASELEVKDNALFCSYDNLGWFIAKYGHGYRTPDMEEFIEIMLDEENNNYCVSSCNLPLRYVKKMDKDGMVADWLCENDYLVSTTTLSEVVEEENIENSSEHFESLKSAAEESNLGLFRFYLVLIILFISSLFL